MKRSRIKSEVIDLINLFDGPVIRDDGHENLEDLLQLLKVGIGYTLLDLEATRRERDAKRQ